LIHDVVIPNKEMATPFLYLENPKREKGSKIFFLVPHSLNGRGARGEGDP